MKIATYWARRSCTADDPDGYPVTRTVLRGSDISLADAEHQAKVACDQICQNIRAGFDPDWYDYDQQGKPEPIDREWFNEAGVRTAAITINRHGIPVLNTASLAFVDVDIPVERKSLLAKLFSSKAPPKEEEHLAQLRAWVSANPSRSARAYRTAGGLRYLIVSPKLDPASTDSARLMDELRADPRYALLCKHQRSYRARLGPKPWRIGCRGINVNAVNQRENPAVDDNLANYNEKARDFAVCELIEELGPSARDAQVADLIRVHDEMCKVGSGLPLA
ncbi:MAG: hypothetical protein ACIARQ_15820 [Phycisphaerales bacterium JB061]